MSKRTKELSALTEPQLQERRKELNMELLKLSAQVASGTTPKSPGLVRQTKRSIARILTIINLKKRGGVDKKV